MTPEVEKAYQDLERAIEGVRMAEGADSLSFLGDWALVAAVHSVNRPRESRYDTFLKDGMLPYHTAIGLFTVAAELVEERCSGPED